MKTFFSAVCVLILAIVFPLMLLISIVRFELLNPSVLKSAVRSAKVGELVPTIVAESAGVPEAEVRTVLSTATAYSVIDVVIDIVTTTVVNPQDKVNIKPLKDELQPLAEQFSEHSGGQLEYQDVPPFSLNDRVTLDELMTSEKNPSQAPSAFSPVTVFGWFTRWLTISWIVFGIALFVLILLKRVPIRTLLSWLSVTSFVLAAETIPVAFGLWVAPAWLNGLLTSDTINQSMQTTITNLANQLASMMAWKAIIVGVVLLVIGIVLLVIRHTQKPRQA